MDAAAAHPPRTSPGLLPRSLACVHYLGTAKDPKGSLRGLHQLPVYLFPAQSTNTQSYDHQEM